MLEKIFCINVKTETYRREMIEKQLYKYYDEEQVEIVNAHTIDDIIDLSPHLLDVGGSSYLSFASEIAISHSHLECIKKVYEGKMVLGGICEDDITLCNNFREKLNKYFEKNENIVRISKKKPMILFLTGLKSRDESKSGKYKFTFKKVEKIQWGNCFYVINHQFAKIIMEKFYPINKPFDDYMAHVINNNKEIYAYNAIPLLCWDLSSNYYSEFWTEEDKKTRKEIYRSSTKTRMEDYAYNFQYNSMKKDGEGELRGGLVEYTETKLTPAKVISVDPEFEDWNYLFMGSIVAKCNNKSIICGAGIENKEDAFVKPYMVSLVRGPLTHNKFLELGYECPKNYGDPGLLISTLYNPSIKQEYKLGIVCTREECSTMRDQIQYMRGVIVIPSDMAIEKMVSNVKACRLIASTTLYGIIISHSYGIKAIWVRPLDRKINYVEFADYYGGLKFYDMKPENHLAVLKNYTLIAQYPNPSIRTIEKKKTLIENNIPFAINFKKIYHQDFILPQKNTKLYKKPNNNRIKVTRKESAPKAPIPLFTPKPIPMSKVEPIKETEILELGLELEKDSGANQDNIPKKKKRRSKHILFAKQSTIVKKETMIIENQEQKTQKESDKQTYKFEDYPVELQNELLNIKRRWSYYVENEEYDLALREKKNEHSLIKKWEDSQNNEDKDIDLNALVPTNVYKNQNFTIKNNVICVGNKIFYL